MGTLQSNPLAALVRHLADRFAITEFVETGTFHGAGAAFAASIFPTVTTIEIDPDFHAIARARLAPSVRCILGDSRAALPGVIAGLSGPTLFWLDGHAGGGHFGSQDDCPLVEELIAISASPHEHFILVDDARAFLAPPPPPFDPGRWPTLRDVLDAACRSAPYFCVVIADTLICVPEKARRSVTEFCNQVRPKI